MDANELRKAFTGFFSQRDHTVVPSASLIPHDKTLLFTVAGMVPFKPYFVGEEPAPWPRAVTVQKCVRAGDKHNDLDEIGRTAQETGQGVGHLIEEFAPGGAGGEIAAGLKPRILQLDRFRMEMPVP